MKASAEDSSKDSNGFQIPWYLVIDSGTCGLCRCNEPGPDHFAPVAKREAIKGSTVVKLYRVPLCEPCAATLKGNPEERTRRTPDLARFIQEHSHLERARFAPEKGHWRLKC